MSGIALGILADWLTRAGIVRITGAQQGSGVCAALVDERLRLRSDYKRYGSRCG